MEKTIQQTTKALYDALSGKYKERTGEVDGKYIGNSRKRISRPATSWRNHFPRPEQWGHDLTREQLEALVLIPEEERIAEVERVYHGGAAVAGFLTPQYTEEALQYLQHLRRSFQNPQRLQES